MIKKYWIADSKTDVENGWTIYTEHKIGTEQFWVACDAELPPHFDPELQETWIIAKAVEIDDNGEWVGHAGSEICWR
jgi:hypothetical protein